MLIKSLVLGQVRTNCYILINEATKETILIDTADEAYTIKRVLETEGLKPVAILLTHGHFDHIMAAKELSEDYQIPIYSFKDEAELLGNPRLNGGSLIRISISLEPDKVFADDEIITLAGITLRVVHTPGHTLGSVCFYAEQEKALFSGDTLFNESIGRTDLPTGNGKTIIDSITNRLMPLDEDVKVYPGHGELTTIGHEKKYNPFLAM